MRWILPVALLWPGLAASPVTSAQQQNQLQNPLAKDASSPVVSLAPQDEGADESGKTAPMVVPKGGYRLQSGPSPMTRRLAVLEPGTKVTLLESRPPWGLLETEDKKLKGWAVIKVSKVPSGSKSLDAKRFATPSTTALASKGLGKEWAKKKGSNFEALVRMRSVQIDPRKLEEFQAPLRRGGRK